MNTFGHCFHFLMKSGPPPSAGRTGRAGALGTLRQAQGREASHNRSVMRAFPFPRSSRMASIPKCPVRALTTHFETPATLRAETEPCSVSLSPACGRRPLGVLPLVVLSRGAPPSAPLPSAETSSRSFGIMSRHSPHARSCHGSCEKPFSAALPHNRRSFPASPFALRSCSSRLTGFAFRFAGSLCYAVRSFFLLRKKTPSHPHRFQGLEKCFPRFGKPEAVFSNAWNETFQALENS